MPVLKSERVKKLPKLAEEYRNAFKAEKPHYSEKGVVRFTSDFTACGWCSLMPEPKTELPGNYAVNLAGEVWQAVGGNAVDGAENWVSVEI